MLFRVSNHTRTSDRTPWLRELRCLFSWVSFLDSHISASCRNHLAIPRLPVPRRSVPPGSVGIAGNQTGVYPFATPGGWRLIGRTPLEMFRGGENANRFVVHRRPRAVRANFLGERLRN